MEPSSPPWGILCCCVATWPLSIPWQCRLSFVVLGVWGFEQSRWGAQGQHSLPTPKRGVQLWQFVLTTYTVPDARPTCNTEKLVLPRYPLPTPNPTELPKLPRHGLIMPLGVKEGVCSPSLRVVLWPSRFVLKRGPRQSTPCPASTLMPCTSLQSPCHELCWQVA